jgi:hypothetical protein
MATIRTFFKRTVGHTSNSNNNNNLNTNSGSIDSSSDTSSSITERNQANDGYSSTSTLGILTVHSDDSRRPLLHSHTTNRRKKFFSRLIDPTTATTMDNQSEQTMEENICLMDKKLPKELVLR